MLTYYLLQPLSRIKSCYHISDDFILPTPQSCREHIRSNRLAHLSSQHFAFHSTVDIRRVIVRRPSFTACGPRSCSFSLTRLPLSPLICHSGFPRELIDFRSHYIHSFLRLLKTAHCLSCLCSSLIYLLRHITKLPLALLLIPINPKYTLYVLVVPFLLRPILQQPFAHATSQSHRLWKEIDSMDGHLRNIGEPTKL